ncbi:TPA: YebC/PmpR family DNA-binding transcriptional regulator [Candidatus Poribacteria bacterium]|nr:YebC/PmpR family DNA-binding transcriptional regulator [Candidatus Poribacteria bacterium]
MAGHSKWAQIKHKKAAMDARRGKLFTKLIREITVAARQGGGDPEANPRLRTAIANARANNMPWDNIERAIKRGTGELEGGAALEEVSYEGYGPGGVALLIEAVTDNRNRTTADIRHILSRNGGSLGEKGCVSWIFDRKGLIVVDKEGTDEEELFMVAVDAGAEDVLDEDMTFEIYTDPENFERVRRAIEEAEFKISRAELTMVPKTTVQVQGKEAERLIKLLDALEDNDDVQKVYSNFEMPDELLEAAEAA